jgi:hypothetical protein
MPRSLQITLRRVMKETRSSVALFILRSSLNFNETSETADPRCPFTNQIALERRCQVPSAQLKGFFQIGPCIAQTVSFGPWVIGVQHVLMCASDPSAACDFGDDRGCVTYGGRFSDPAMEF